jgi:hypothetical protein
MLEPFTSFARAGDLARVPLRMLEPLTSFSRQADSGGKARGRIGRAYLLETCHFLAVLVHDLMGTPKLHKQWFLGMNVLRPGLGGPGPCVLVFKCCRVSLQPGQGVRASTGSAKMLQLGC